MAPLLGTLALLLLPWIARGADAGAAPPYLPRKGLALTLWAREPEVADPVALNFDDQGRLYVAETARRGTVDIDIRSHPDWLVDDLSNRSIDDLRRFFRTRMSVAQSEANARWLPDHNRDGVHDWRDLMGIQERIRLLEDPGHSGHATRSTLFYEGFHEEVTGVLAGVFPWNGDVFATVYPDLWRLRDPRHTGTPVAVESVAHGFGVHAAFDGHDLHGLVMGPDGKIYFSQGDNGFVVRTREGATLRYPNTGGVFRMNPDGSELEVFAYGLRNVQEIAFDEFGNMFGVDNDGDLADERERFVYITEGSDSGWRLHWQFKDRGWRAQTRVPDYNPWIQERMWVPHHPGQPAHITPPISNYSVGPSGFRYNPGTGLNDSYRGSFFLVQFPVQKITSFKTRPRGAGFEMVGEHVLLSGMMASAVSFGPDGALYVADWDGMWNPDGKGAIWVLDDPTVSGSPLRREVRDLLHDGMRDKDSSRLQQLLAHPDMRIRLRSQFELVRRQEGSLLVKLARDTALPRLARIHALWGLGQLRLRNAAGRLPCRPARRRPKRAGGVVVEVRERGHPSALAGGGHRRGFLRGAGGRGLDQRRRQATLEHVEQRHRAQEGVDLVPQFLPQVVGQALAAVGAAAQGAHLRAARRLDRLVDRQDDFRHPRLDRGPRQAIAAAWSAHALDQSGPPQPGEQLLEIRQRDFLPGRDVRQGNRLGLGMTRQINHRHYGVTTLGAELHSILLVRDFPASSSPERPKRLETGASLTICPTP
mgnify:CR=1 FL=1